MIESPAGTYDNAFQTDNVYGHALELLVRHKVQVPDGIHLDVGCGYGRIAEPLVAALGVQYVGCDADSAGLESLRQRGFETHQLLLGNEDDTFRALQQIVGNRPLASITILDTLEHLPDTSATLRALRRVAQGGGAFVVLSVPNVTHFDIGAKLILGRLDITDVGILDHTHMRTFSAATLDRELRAAGLYPVDSRDTKLPASDQHFPKDHPLLSQATEVGALLRSLRREADPAHEEVLQLVRICSPGSAAAEVPFVKAYAEEKRPFLTAVVRTRGRRLHTLRETLLCLGGQTDQDIEVLVVGHRLEPDAIKSVERVIDDQPEDMRHRTRLIRVEDGNRVRPLNVGFAEATGRYIAIVDDDDLPMAHWVETFRKLDRRAPGRLLRTASVRQNVRSVNVQGSEGLRDEGPPERIYSKTFDVFEHLLTNQSPPISLAFPRGAFHDLGLRFDETMTTTEDWDFMMRVVLLLGVESSTERTGVYRWWVEGESSRTDHDESEWRRNFFAIVRKLDSRPLMLPAGSVERLRQLLEVREAGRFTEKALRSDNAVLKQEKEQLQSRIGHMHEELIGLQQTIKNSTALRIAAAMPRPIRSFLRRTVRGTYWLFTGQLFRKIKARRI
jgi:2-polyprenyl-3-methyl-5-hydroxy-6-metoxy-1,4-benzoquinol methylase/glycosyltransferase involved in cell wall biosynthesis